MKISRKICSFVLLICIVLSACFIGGASSVTAQAETASNDQSSTVTSAGNSALTWSNYKFTENFSGDFSKWSDVLLKDGYESDFQIVSDPENSDNKVMTFTKLGAFKRIADEYWPADGQMSHISFKAKFINESFSNYGSSMIFSLKDSENFDSTFYYSDYNDKNGLYLRYTSFMDGVESGRRTGTPNVEIISKTEWLTYEIAFSDTNINITISDDNENIITTVMLNHFPTGRFALGGMNLNQYNSAIGDGQYYIDDIEVTFKKLSVDLDDEIKDVEVFYSGNTFYEPGDTVSITGEKLGTTVASAEILQLDNSAADISLMNYLTEQDYNCAVAEQNHTWDEIKANSSASALPLNIIQRSNIGIKFEIPETMTYGVYAVLLKAAHAEGKDAIVFINNPKIDFLSHNDGEAATPGGYLKIAGNNLSVQDDSAAISAVIEDANGVKVAIDNNSIFAYTSANNQSKNNEGKANDYFIQLTLPENLAEGDYTVSLHNGYGGNFGWSVPYKFKVKANTHRAEWRDNGFYNVKDYGAFGEFTYGNTTRDANTNDTAAIISALEAASKTGGIVYFPAGHYRITDTLYIPDNVTLQGEENYQTGIFFDDVGWITPPETMVFYGNNVEFENLYFYGGVTRTLFKQKESLANEQSHIYFKNVRCLFDPSISCSNNGRANLEEGYTYLTAQLYIKEQSITYGYNFLRNYVIPEYLELNNFDVFYESGFTTSDSTTMLARGKYLDMYACEFDGFSGVSGKVAGFMDNCTWDGCLAWSGNTMYTNCNGGNGTNNNREIFTCDGHARDQNSVPQNFNIDWDNTELVKELMGDEYDNSEVLNAAKKFALDNKGKAYRILNKRIYQEGSYADSYRYIYIHNGQGMGQAREITSIEQIGNYSYIIVDSPFAVEPNRNSRAYFHPCRINMYCVSNNFYNGRHAGTFGTCVDAVYDDVTMREAPSGIELHLCQSGVWYVTCREIDSDDIITGRTNTLYTEAMSMLTNGGKPVEMAFAGILWRDNTIGDGGYMLANYSGTAAYGMNEVIIEDNIFETDLVDGVQGFATTNVAVDGIYFKDNIQYMSNGEITDPYSAQTVSALRSVGKNKFGSYRIMCDDIQSSSVSVRQYGDVNNDGRVSLKDVTILRYYFTGQYEPTGNDRAIATWMDYADCNRDKSVNTLDIFAIFCKILGIDYEGEGSGTSSGGSGGEQQPEPTVPDAPEKNIITDETELDYSGVLADGETPVIDNGDKDDTDLDYDSVTPQD